MKELIDGRYRVVRPLGRGGMGVVHLARDENLERDVVVKMVAADAAADPVATARFRREAVLQAAVRHENVAQVYAFGREPEGWFFIQEYIHGRALEAVLASARPAGASLLPVPRTLGLVRQVASALAAVHAAGIVHRDVKPGNVVIERDTGRAVLIDFGLARRMASRDPRSTMGAGTPLYIAPELVGVSVPAELLTPRADVYSLACMAFEMLTGRAPFETDDLEEAVRLHRSARPPAPSSLHAPLAPFDAALACALAKNPVERFDGPLAFAAALDAAGRTRSRPPAAPSASQPPPEPAAEFAPAAHAAPSVVRVLVIDDDPDFLRLAVRAAQLAFFGGRVKVVGASSGAAALADVRVAPPSLVLLDFNMPGIDGIETLSLLRELPGGQQARIVVVSANIDATTRDRFAALGVQDFVEKPVDLRELVQAVNALAERAGWLSSESWDPDR
jgi:serine/threonine-protein kinase